MNRIKGLIYILFIIGVVLGVSSCSQESNSFVSRSYHNLAARYNCYFLAKEKMLDVESKISKSYTDNYNYILPYFPPLDTNFNKSLSGDFDYIFEKAQIPIVRHKNSNWVSESYNIIGKSKWLENNVDSAIYVFKYVIARSDDIPGKQRAQTYLLRTYVSQNDYRSADDEFAELQKQKVFDENELEYNIAFIEYLYGLRRFEEMLPYLESSIPLVKNKDKRSRLRFIIGQINQRLGNNEEAYKRYKKSLKRNPPYEIEFNAKLNISQVTDIESKKQIKKVNKYYDKLLTDAKNEEYHGRIYYERGKFELKRGNLSQAINYLNLSLEAPSTPEDQKAFAYLLLGKLFYEQVDSLPTKVDKYKTAKLYYDSTITAMTPNFENAEAIIERQEILANFVQELEIVETEERLQRWAALSPEELEREVQKKIKQDEEKLKREAAIQKKREERAKEAAQNSNNPFDDVSTVQFGNTGFFAYSPVAVASQKIKFQEVWGDRPLEDNWRRSEKEEPLTDDLEELENENNTDPSLITSEDSLNAGELPLAQEGNDSTETGEISLSADSYTNDIPDSPEKIAASNKKLVEAKYNLGKIYYYDLGETDNAQAEFESYLEQLPGTKYEAEIIYFLYIICNQKESCDPQKYKNLEREKYPNSIYYKYMEDADYLTSNKDNNLQAQRVYAKIFQLYRDGKYLQSRSALKQLTTDFPKNNIPDKIKFLEILTYAKNDELSKYYVELSNFKEDFGTSPLKKEADRLLATKPKNIDAFKINSDTSFYRNDSITHVFVAEFKTKEMPFEEINRIYEEFRATYYKTLTLSTKKIDFTDSTYLIVNKEFKDFESIKAYHDKLLDYHEFGQHLEKVEYSYYIVTLRNYETLLRTKNINGYGEFYRETYNISQ